MTEDIDELLNYYLGMDQVQLCLLIAARDFRIKRTKLRARQMIVNRLTFECLHDTHVLIRQATMYGMGMTTLMEVRSHGTKSYWCPGRKEYFICDFPITQFRRKFCEFVGCVLEL